MGLVLQLIPLLAGTICLTWLTILVMRWPTVGWCIISTAILVAGELPQTPPVAGFGGLAIYAEDAVCIALLIAALPKLRRVNHSRNGRSVLLIIFVVLLVASLLRGMAVYGLGLAVNESRQLLYLVVAIAWALSQVGDENFEVRLRRFMSFTGWGLIGVAAYHVATTGLGTADGMLLRNGHLVTDRPLVSGQSCVLALIGVHAVVARRRSLPGWVFLGVVVLTQHRSVWVAAAAALGMALVAASPRIRARLVIGVLVVSLLGVAFLTSEQGAEVMAKLSYSASSTGTIDDRTYGWIELLRQSQRLGWGEAIWGQPMGSSYRRLNIDGRLVEYAPHNWYVTVYLRMGILGIAALAGILGGAFRRHVQERRLPPLVWLTLIAVYAIPYGLPWYLAPFLAISLVLTSKEGHPNAAPQVRAIDDQLAEERAGSRAAITSAMGSRRLKMACDRERLC